jgi:hypothetical protein
MIFANKISGSQVMAWLGVGVLILAAYRAHAESAPSPNWQLATDNTSLTLAVINDRPAIYQLANPAQGWNWTPTHTEFPLLAHAAVGSGPVQAPDWKFQDAAVDDSNGRKVTLRFTSTTPKLELKSVWWARKGPGPVEESMTIANQTGDLLVLNGSDMVTADLALVADNPATLWRFNKTPRAGGPDAHGVVRTDVGVFTDKLAAGMTVKSEFGGHPGDSRTDDDLPFEMYDVGAKHGFYLGYLFGYGLSITNATGDGLHLTDRLYLNDGERVEAAKDQSLTIPGLFIGTYQGDTDDGSNQMKKWFWNYKIPAYLKRADEPLVELCSDHVEGNFDKLMAMVKATDFVGLGVGIYKVDAWYAGDLRFCAPGAFPYSRVDELAAALHAKGVRLSVWQPDMISEEHLLARYDKWHFDYYRSDQGGVHPADYRGYVEFWKKLDDLETARPGLRWENCLDGGSLKSFDDCQRMSFMTTSDSPNTLDYKKALYPNSYMINPLQLKSDCFCGDIFDLRCAMMGSILTGIPGQFGIVSEADMKKEFTLYNARQAPILRGADIYHILPMPNGRDWDGLEYFNTEIAKGSLFLFKPAAEGGDAHTIKLKGLNRATIYTLTFEDRPEQTVKKTGAELMDAGLPITLTGPHVSEIVWIE